MEDALDGDLGAQRQHRAKLSQTGFVDQEGLGKNIYETYKL